MLAFQRNNNLPETGIADSETQRKLYSDPSTLVASSDDAAFGGELTRIQTMLGLWGFYGGKIDGTDRLGHLQRHPELQALHAPCWTRPSASRPPPSPPPRPNPDGKFSDMPVVMDQPLVDEVELDSDQ